MKKTYRYDTNKKVKGKEDPVVFVKWLRRNLGTRGEGWDFTFHGGCVIIDIWESRLQTMYELWKE